MTCQQCHRPAPTAFLCRVCSDRLRTWLTDLEGHADDLVNVIAQQTSRADARVMVRGTPEVPLPVNLAASEVADLLRADLVLIVRSLSEDRGVAYDGGTTSPDLARWLAGNVAAIALSPDALETYGIVENAAATGVGADQQPKGYVVKAVDTRPTRRLLGPCDVRIVDGECRGDVRAPEGAEHASCVKCGFSHVADAFQRRALLRLGDHLRTAGEITLILSGQIRPGTLRQWKRRGRVLADGSIFTSHGVAPWDGSDLFRVADVLELLRPAPADGVEAA